MDNQNSTEKSVGFFSLSVILHVSVVAAILAGAAYRATQSESEGSKGETVSMEMIDSGEAEVAAPAVEEKSEVQVTPVVAEKPVEQVKPKVVPVVAAKPVEKPVAKAKTVVAAKPVAKPVQKVKPTPNAIPTETQETEDAPAVAVAPPTPIEESVDAQAEAEEVTATPTEDAQETKPEAVQSVAAVPPRPAAETVHAEPAAEQAAPAESVAQAAPAAAAATVTEGSGSGEGIAKGDGSGDTPEDAKAFTDVKQKPGNRTPKYPMNSRRAKQEGQVELMYFVTNQGAVDQIKITKSSGFASLDQEAMQSVRNYKFYPGQEGWTTHPITFSLQGDAQQVGGLRHK